MRFLVKLKKAHQEKGLSTVDIHKATGIAINSVARYVSKDSVEVGYLSPIVIKLAQFYGLDWRDPSVVEIIPEDEDTPETKTPLLATA